VKEGMKIGERMECVLNALFEVVVGKKCVCLGGGQGHTGNEDNSSHSQAPRPVPTFI